MTPRDTPLSFADALPALRAARDAGRLVPFVGAGISRPYCRGWPDFIDGLYKEFQDDRVPRAGNLNTEQLLREADRVAVWLRLLPPEQRRKRINTALRDSMETALPPQATALAGIVWPLIITTNYDGVMREAISRAHAAKRIRVLGRAAQDCIEVVRSLDAIGDPILWHVQGHVGATGQSEEGVTVSPSLLDEVVVGHQQYQEAINASAFFRRAFSEVFRRRSLLFVGSGLAESYVVNLIGEALFSLGPGSHPHFALVCDTDLANGIDPEFLAVRLGITTLRYGKTHNDLRDALLELVPPPETPTTHVRLGMQSVSYALPSPDGAALSGRTVELRFGKLAEPEMDGCIILSVGRDGEVGHRRPGLGEQALSFLEERRSIPRCRAVPFEDVPIVGRDQGRMFQVAIESDLPPVFLLAAREMNEQRDDAARSLAAIIEATAEGLAVAKGFKTVSMGLMAAGPHRADDARLCLIAQLTGIREFATKAPMGSGVETIRVSILDESVWAAVCEGRIPVAEILSSNIVRVRVRVRGTDGSTESFAMSVLDHQTVGEVLEAYRITNRPDCIFEIRPLTRRVEEQAVQDIRVFPGMVIDVIPRHAGAEAEAHSDAASPHQNGKS